MRILRSLVATHQVLQESICASRIQTSLDPEPRNLKLASMERTLAGASRVVSVCTRKRHEGPIYTFGSNNSLQRIPLSFLQKSVRMSLNPKSFSTGLDSEALSLSLGSTVAGTYLIL